MFVVGVYLITAEGSVRVRETKVRGVYCLTPPDLLMIGTRRLILRRFYRIVCSRGTSYIAMGCSHRRSVYFFPNYYTERKNPLNSTKLF